MANPFQGLGGLLSSAPPTNQYFMQWAFVTTRFSNLLDRIQLTENQIKDGFTKSRNISNTLSKAYWESNPVKERTYTIGSWAKNTAIRPPSDIDLLFEIPSQVVQKYQSYSGNIQSYLLQEIRNTLSPTYPQTEIKGDRHVVSVNFQTLNIEVVPWFHHQGQIYICDTKNGGNFIINDYAKELDSLKYQNQLTYGNTTNLIKLIKQWKNANSIQISSFAIELLVMEFLHYYINKSKSLYWYDWIVRDFFHHLSLRQSLKIKIPFTDEELTLDHQVISRARAAHEQSCHASEYERYNNNLSAANKWSEVFGIKS